MARHASVFLVLVCLLALPALAGENHNAGLGFSRSDMLKSRVAAGRFGAELFAAGGVDVAALTAELEGVEPSSPQDFADRINAQRELLYPDEEIILSIGPREEGGGVADHSKAALVKAIYWWNNTNCSTCYWFAQYSSTVATLFVDDVQYGRYRVSDKVGNGAWVYRYLTAAGGASTRYTTGAKTNRGFRGDADGVSSKADIVIYFFN
jgi:hypothetical protein